jgi:hypothetical protein
MNKKASAFKRSALTILKEEVIHIAHHRHDHRRMTIDPDTAMPLMERLIAPPKSPLDDMRGLREQVR